MKVLKSKKYIPDEIIIVLDGPIEDFALASVRKWSESLPLKICELRQNMGLAYALNYGMKLCSYEWIFRMDIDDVVASDRFTKQINVINQNQI